MANLAVSVVIPWRPTPGRGPLLDYVRAWWAGRHPDWQIVVGAHLDGPWVKAAAVADALTRATGDLLVVADADVVCDGIGDAVDQVAAGAPWSLPHLRVYRLTPDATAAVVDGGPLPEPLAGPVRRGRRNPTQPARRIVRPPAGPIHEYHDGMPGGGMVALPRTLYDRAPLDPRFAGWGQEDASWAAALRTMAGAPWRGRAPMWHLWHPPQERTYGDGNRSKARTIGSAAGLALRQRYTAAARSGPAAMAALLAEAAAPSLLPASTHAGSSERGPTTL